MLFKLEQEKSPFVLNPELQTIKEFVCLTDRQFFAVALFTDYQSPLRTLPEKQRREQAALIAGWPMEGKRLDKNGRNFVDGNVKSMEKAITKYREIQYNEDRETIDRLDKQIQENMAAIEEDKETASIKKVVTKAGGVIEIKDKKLQYELVEKANKFARELPDLIEAKQKLQALFNLKETEVDVPTYTSTDIADDESELSTLDKFMNKQKNE